MDVSARKRVVDRQITGWVEYMRDVQAMACDAKNALYRDDRTEAYAALDRLLELEPDHWRDQI